MPSTTTAANPNPQANAGGGVREGSRQTVQKTPPSLAQHPKNPYL